MPSDLAKNLKKTFSEAPEHGFEHLTFGELRVGERFISLPSPGDNTGHGGFKTTFWVFIKTKRKVKEIAPGIPYSRKHPKGKARIEKHKEESDFPHSMPVIRVN